MSNRAVPDGHGASMWPLERPVMTDSSRRPRDAWIAALDGGVGEP